MSTERASKPSFSAGRRLNGAVHAVLGTLAVVALVVMANYLAGRHSFRWFVSSESALRLAPQTLSLLKTLTNDVKVIVFYDRDETSFKTVDSLLREYELANPHIKKTVVDYIRDAGLPQQVATQYNLTTNKNVVIFDCEGRSFWVPGTGLTQFKRELVAQGEKPEFEDRPVAFHGQRAFTFALLAVMNPKPLQAFFLTGHDEHPPEDDKTRYGYRKFAELLAQNRFEVLLLPLTGTNTVPGDCSLLVVAGPRKAIPPTELEKIDQYLKQGGRLLALFNSLVEDRSCGLESVLSQWGVQVGTNAVMDLPHSTKGTGGRDLIVSDLSSHPAVAPLRHAAPPLPLHLILPRSVARLPAALQSADAPTVEEIARASKTSAFYSRDDQDKQPVRPSLPLAVAVEKGAVKGVVTERGTTRMIVVGDSFFLANEMIESAGNRSFAALAVNWLLDRTQLLQLEPQPVTEFRLVLSRSQLQTVQWLLLGGIPGGVLLFGGLVWLRRRR